MKKSRLFFRLSLLLLCVVLMLSLLGCKNTLTNSDGAKTDSPDATEYVPVYSDIESEINYDNAQTLDFSGDITDVKGVKQEGNIVTIGTGGTYILTGTLSSGQIVVNADKQDVWLVMDNAHITCEDSSPLYIADAKNTYLVLKTDSENSLTDSSAYSVGADEDPDATLFCKNDLIISGQGSLTINSNYNNALHTKDTLTIAESTLAITSVDTGIKAKDGITIESGNITITCAGDGIQTTNSEDSSLGNMEIHGGNITIDTEKDAIQSENALTITGGTFNITTGDGAENADYNYGYGGFMGFGYYYGDNSSDVSMKALKSQGALLVTGGVYNINSEDDSLHSNSDVTISGGEFTIKSGDDGVHSDEKLTITNGTIDILTSYEGLEGTEVSISGGDIHLVASDDGINSAGGGDTSYGGFGKDSFGNSSSYALNISGGYVYIDAVGDGLDSNGSITIEGGTTIVNGPTSGGNSPFDWESSCYINGGTFIAVGSSDMMETVSTSSTQCSIAFYLNGSFSANTLCNLSSSDGFDLTFAPSKSFGYLFVTSPDLKIGNTYTLSAGGSHSGNVQDGLYTEGTYSDGTEYTQITLNNIVTTSGSGGMGGMGSMGGGNHGGKPW